MITLPPYVMEQQECVGWITRFTNEVKSKITKENASKLLEVMVLFQEVVHRINKRALVDTDHFFLTNDEWTTLSRARKLLVDAGQTRLAVTLAVAIRRYM